jgi:methylphosphotriester-DNA--protein-cysteine methyltransferase
MLDDETCYARLARRDPTADGEFFVAVKTTRIYCRPICPARLPLRKNVSFLRTAAEAHARGFRPCLRCRPESAPDSPAWLGTLASVRRALRLIDSGFLVTGNIDSLADSLGMTARHLRRLFTYHIGASPIEVEQVRRLHLAQKLLHETDLPITDIAFAAGYGSIRRFNEVFLNVFKRPPSTLRGKRAVEASDARLTVSISATSSTRPYFESLRMQLPISSGGSALIGPMRNTNIAVELKDVAPKNIAQAISEVKTKLISESGNNNLANLGN